MGRYRATLIWTTLAALVVVPIAAAATSPLLAWRAPIYILAGFSGVLAMTLLLLQPLLIGGHLRVSRARQFHRLAGAMLVLMIIAHVGGLWITSPPDVIDALRFQSPTSFSAWGVIAMWGVFATALLAVLRRRLRPRHWRLGHTALGMIIVIGSVVHAVQIDGTMELWSKTLLCIAVIAATGKTIYDKRALHKPKSR